MQARIAASSSRVLVILLTLAFVVTWLPPRSLAVTSARIEARKRDAAAAQAELDELSAQLELRSEELGQIESQLEKTRRNIVLTEKELDRAEAELAVTQDRLADRVASIYRTGGVEPIAFFVGVSDFADLLTRLELLRRISNQDAETVRSVRLAKQRVEYAKATLERRESEQIALRVRAREKRAEVAEALHRQKAYLASIQKDVARLIAEERKRQERIAAERARRIAAALARQRHLRIPARVDPSELGGPHAQVVLVASKYVGVPYVWGGSTPSGFDCSGLVQYCYAEIGISLPRTARDQYFAGSPIPADRLDLLQAGDLVFFAYDQDAEQIHHVGIYSGNGTFIHAPQTGDVVGFASLTERIAARGDYIGACRP